MSAPALVAVLVSALLHAAWNALLKREPDVRAAAIAIQVLTAAIGAAAALLDPARTLGGPRAAAWGAAAGTFEAAYFVTLAAALSAASLGLAYTVARGGALLLVWPASVLLLGERPSATALAGTALLLAGLVVVSGDHLETSAGGGGARRREGLLWSILCAGAIAGYGLCYKLALAAGAAPTSLFALSLGVSVPLVLARTGREGIALLVRALGRRPGPLLAASLASALSFLLVLFALRAEGAGAVLTLRNTSVLFAILLAAAIGEKPGPRQVAGAVLVTLGAVLVGWPR